CSNSAGTDGPPVSKKIKNKEKKMKEWKVAAAVVLSMTVLAGYSFAQPGNGPGRGQGRGMKCIERFSALDTDKNGKVTFEEFMAISHPRGDEQAKAMFKAKDTDNNEELTQAEFCPRT
ncbi:MAG: EF-hand domain-containing protein, partial [Candidatus Electrothrix sp. ATG2]|nr:EF-hand domain-containing protein [Candidatus Electrothrix sp. ATG2]